MKFTVLIAAILLATAVPAFAQGAPIGAPNATPNYGCSLLSVSQISTAIAKQAVADSGGDEAHAVTLYRERNKPAIQAWLSGQSSECRARLLYQAQKLAWMRTHDEALFRHYLGQLISAETGKGGDTPDSVGGGGTSSDGGGSSNGSIVQSAGRVLEGIGAGIAIAGVITGDPLLTGAGVVIGGIGVLTEIAGAAMNGGSAGKAGETPAERSGR